MLSKLVMYLIIEWIGKGQGLKNVNVERQELYVCYKGEKWS